MKNKSKKRNKISVFLVVMLVVLLIYSLSLIVPMVWSVMSSLKSRRDFLVNPFRFPEKLMFSNYKVAFLNFYVSVSTKTGSKRVYMDSMLINSIIYAGTCAFISTFVSCIMAYVVAKYKFYLNKIIYGIVIVTMILPIVGALPSEIQMAKAVGTFDSIFGMWLMKANFLGFYFLVFHAIFKSVSWEYAESAFVDGASHYRVMFSIMLPLVKTTFAAVYLLYFIQYWNDYQTPMIYLPSMPTAAFGMFLYQFSHVNEINSVPMQLAGCMILFLPILLIFLVFRNKLNGNLTMGGLKG